MTNAFALPDTLDGHMALPLRETFNALESRKEVTTLVIDMAGSTEIKLKQSEAAWLNQLGWLYEHATDIVRREIPGVVIKYIGDGLMAVCSSDHATEAMTAAILVQEDIKDANRGADGAKGIIDFNIYAAITTGKAVEFLTPDGTRDYVGAPVDKAHRLCGAANEKAILIDRATAAAANMGRANSHVGRVMDRTTDEYQGDLNRVMLKSFGQPVEFYEFQWDRQRYSVNGETVTANTDRVQPTAEVTRIPMSPQVPTQRTGREERHAGRMKCWFGDRGFGFVVDELTGEEFHVSSRSLIYSEDLSDLARDTRIAFTAQDAPAPGRNRRAAGALIVGNDAEGVLVSLPAGRPYGWIKVEGAPGNSHLVYMALKDNPGSFGVGDLLTFDVAATGRGACAQAATRADNEAA
jgi:class 3 adenylate cyclase